MAGTAGVGPVGCGRFVGGCSGIFGGPEGPDRGQEWVYRGGVQGDYEKIEALVYVGEGNGHYGREELNRQRPPPHCVAMTSTRKQWWSRLRSRSNTFRRLYMSVMLMLAIAGAACLLTSLATGPKRPQRKGDEDIDASEEAVRRAPHVAATAAPPSPASSEKPVSAETTCSSPPDLLPDMRKEWCCVNKGLMCPQLDCDAGYLDWHREWSRGKKLWCCRHFKKGCAAAPAPGAVDQEVSRQRKYDCKKDPSGSKADWCCKHEHLGCNTTSAPAMNSTSLRGLAHGVPE